MDQARRGDDALKAGKYNEAIEHFTDAIKASPNAVNYYIQRSTAYQRSTPSDNKSALADAEVAVVLAQKRASRELITKAQLRRGIALFNLERFKDAEFVFDLVKQRDPKEKTLSVWEAKVKKKLSELDAGEEGAVLSVKETPEVELPGESKAAAPTPTSVTKSTSSAAEPVQPKPVVQTPVDKIKNEWYQNNEFVFFTLLAKGVPKDKAVIDIQERSLSISFPTLSGATFDFSLEPLFAPIDPAQSTSNIMSTKVEIKLKKSTPGVKWKELEGNDATATTVAQGTTSTIPHHILESQSSKAPAYPTSSRKGPKDWDKVANDLAGKPKAGPTGKVDDDWDDEDGGGDEVNNFFKKLYKDASPDVRRAMMKSYQESNGTALSTNWEDVSKGTVATEPPDGMEARKW